MRRPPIRPLENSCDVTYNLQLTMNYQIFVGVNQVNQTEIKQKHANELAVILESSITVPGVT